MMAPDPSALQTLLIFACIYGASIATGFWESYAEGRNAWDKAKLGWKVRLGSFTLTGYHFNLFWLTFPLLLALPFIVYGWNFKLFGIIISAYVSGMIIEDLIWYIVNPVVRFSEWFTPFSDYYPWIRIGGRKILPVGYVVGIGIALLSWFFIWK